MEKDELTYHVPVLLKESVDGMNIRPDGTYVDVTFGGEQVIRARFFRDSEKADGCWDLIRTKMPNGTLSTILTFHLCTQ